MAESLGLSPEAIKTSDFTAFFSGDIDQVLYVGLRRSAPASPARTAAGWLVTISYSVVEEFRTIPPARWASPEQHPDLVAAQKVFAEGRAQRSRRSRRRYAKTRYCRPARYPI